LNFDTAAVELDQAFDDAQAQAGAGAGFGGEEGFEDFLEVLLRDVGKPSIFRRLFSKLI
jgi:hypothetical protein